MLPLMKPWVVVWVNLMECNVSVDFVRSDDWRHALIHARRINLDEAAEIPADLEEAKDFYSDCDVLIEVLEVPNI